LVAVKPWNFSELSEYQSRAGIVTASTSEWMRRLRRE
jgi:hypothetical protein